MKKLLLTNVYYFIVYFYSGCLCLVTISLIISVVVINMSKRVYCKPLPRNIKLCLLSWPGKVLGLSDFISVVILVLKLKIIFIKKSNRLFLNYNTFFEHFIIIPYFLQHILQHIFLFISRLFL